MTGNHDEVTMSRHPSFALAALILATTTAVSAEDWPQWRGARSDGVWRDKGIVESIPEVGMPIRWRARLRIDARSDERDHIADLSTG